MAQMVEHLSAEHWVLSVKPQNQKTKQKQKNPKGW
jgi:hypothetical protein